MRRSNEHNFYDWLNVRSGLNFRHTHPNPSPCGTRPREFQAEGGIDRVPVNPETDPLLGTRRAPMQVRL
ncbi:hypothetical protein APPUASWS_028320 [Arthrospira platensis str. Paraca]|nr:hypothetical protein APPUASWS_028320 [Arthrospira platensis str. Paraca]